MAIVTVCKQFLQLFIASGAVQDNLILKTQCWPSYVSVTAWCPNI